MRKLGRDIAIGLAVTAGLVVLAEVGLRIVWRIKWPQNPEGTPYDQNVGFKYRKGKHELKKTDTGFTGMVNSLGYRGEEWTPKKAKGVFRIICCGDSVALGLGTKKIDSDYPHQLQIILNQNPPKGIRYEVYNAGVGGNASYHTLYRLKNDILPHKPDLIVFTTGSDDMFGINPEFPKSYHPNGSLTKLARHSYLVRMSAGVVFKVIMPKMKLSEKQIEAKRQEYERFVPEYFITNLAEMIALCRAQNVDATLATMPTLVNYPGIEKHPEKIALPYFARSFALYRILVNHYNDAISKSGANEGVAVIDMAKIFNELPNAMNIFIDNYHFTDEGYKVYAKILAQELYKKGVLKRTSARKKS